MKLLKTGFTLLELLIVISIIGILVAVAAASYSSAQIKAKNSRRMSDIKAVQSGMEQYFADKGTYPPTASPCNPGATYLPIGLPTDPKPTYSYVVSCTTAATTTYYATAHLEPNGNTFGNASGSDCAGYGSAGEYFCVKNLQ